MKPVVTEIDPNKLKQLRAMLKPGISKSQRRDLVKKYVGSECLGCEKLPTKLVSYDISDEQMSAKQLERYCDDCFIRLVATNGIDETLAARNEPKNIKSE